MFLSKPPADPYEQGMSHLKKGEYDRAVAAFTEAIRLKPNVPNAYAGRALAYRSLENETNALQDEQKVRELGGVRSPTGEFIILLTTDQQIYDRMDRPDRFADFVTSMVDATAAYFKKFPPARGIDLRVACAVLPESKMLLEISLFPHDHAEEINRGLRRWLEALPTPAVRNGPIAFASQTVVLGGAAEEHQGFGFPFASVCPSGDQRALDDALMVAGERIAGTPPSWWTKFKRTLGF